MVEFRNLITSWIILPQAGAGLVAGAYVVWGSNYKADNYLWTWTLWDISNLLLIIRSQISCELSLYTQNIPLLSINHLY